MKKLLLALALFLAPSVAFGQCSGVFPANTICGNNSGIPAVPTAMTFSSGVAGPGSTVVGHFATWSNTIGTTLADFNLYAATNTWTGTNNYNSTVNYTNVITSSGNNNWNGTNTYNNTITANNPIVSAGNNTWAGTNIFNNTVTFNNPISSGANNTWTGTNTFSSLNVTGGAITSAPTAASTNQGINIAQSGPTSSTTAGVVSNCWNGGNAAVVFNQICVLGQAIHPTGTGVPKTIGTALGLTMGGGNSQGTNIATEIQLFANVASSPPVNSRDRIALNINALDSVGDGGTNTGAGASGTLFGTGIGVNAVSGATNLFVVSGAEVDIGIATGASSKYRLGWSIVDNGNLQAASLDTAYEVGAAGGSPGFKTAFLLSNIHGHAPLSTTGCVICTDGSVNTITTGIDLTNTTITGFLLKGTGTIAGTKIVGNNSQPTNSACAGFALGTSSTDLAGVVNFSSATTCTINFGTPFAVAPFCVITGTTPSTTAFASTTTQLTLSFGTAQTAASWICFGS